MATLQEQIDAAVAKAVANKVGGAETVQAAQPERLRAVSTKAKAIKPTLVRGKAQHFGAGAFMTKGSARRPSHATSMIVAFKPGTKSDDPESVLFDMPFAIAAHWADLLEASGDAKVLAAELRKAMEVERGIRSEIRPGRVMNEPGSRYRS